MWFTHIGIESSTSHGSYICLGWLLFVALVPSPYHEQTHPSALQDVLQGLRVAYIRLPKTSGDLEGSTSTQARSWCCSKLRRQPRVGGSHALLLWRTFDQYPTQEPAPERHRSRGTGRIVVCALSTCNVHLDSAQRSGHGPLGRAEPYGGR